MEIFGRNSPADRVVIYEAPDALTIAAGELSSASRVAGPAGFTRARQLRPERLRAVFRFARNSALEGDGFDFSWAGSIRRRGGFWGFFYSIKKEAPASLSRLKPGDRRFRAQREDPKLVGAF
jgi:hypothetical protein